MIELASGDILNADAEALVNTVNTVGVMGKGIALQFRQAFPENYKVYRRACEQKEIRIGQMFVFHLGRMANPRLIINFPTKRHWKQKARMEDIEAGLVALAEVIEKEKIHSIAVPPLGCGSGGLGWEDVRPRIENALSRISRARILLYQPEGAPPAQEMMVATMRPNMTAGRAALISLMRNYVVPGYQLTLLEIQKLAYLLQAAGEPLRLNFTKSKFGPYAQTLEHVLQRIEGHFVRGYGDRSRRVSIVLLPGAAEAAEAYLENSPQTRERLERVTKLIEGFETPYGMELLATVHWSAEENPRAGTDLPIAISAVQKWSERKRRTFTPHHVEVAWNHMHEQGWL